MTIQTINLPANQTPPSREAMIKTYAPFYVALDLDVSNWPVADLYRLVDCITDNSDVLALWRTNYDRFRAGLKSTAEEWTLADYLAAVPNNDLMIAAVTMLPQKIKAAIRARILAKRQEARDAISN